LSRWRTSAPWYQVTYARPSSSHSARAGSGRPTPPASASASPWWPASPSCTAGGAGWRIDREEGRRSGCSYRSLPRTEPPRSHPKRTPDGSPVGAGGFEPPTSCVWRTAGPGTGPGWRRACRRWAASGSRAQPLREEGIGRCLELGEVTGGAALREDEAGLLQPVMAVGREAGPGQGGERSTLVQSHPKGSGHGE